MADERVEFRFKYNPENNVSELDAYDASQALYGISRSLSIFTHYAINQKVIKKAPALSGARVLLIPPQAGSFEFILPIIQSLSEPISKAALGVAKSFIYDLAKVTFARLTGKKDKATDIALLEVSRRRPGDLDAIADSVEEDVNRIHRPMVLNVNTINVYGGHNNIANFDQSTFDFAKTKVVGDVEEEYFGHVTSYNGSSGQGRLWIESEERTVGFSVHKNVTLKSGERKRLAWSLSQWVSDLEGYITVSGYALTSKQGLLKHVFLTSVRKA